MIDPLKLSTIQNYRESGLQETKQELERDFLLKTIWCHTCLVGEIMLV